MNNNAQDFMNILSYLSAPSSRNRNPEYVRLSKALIPDLPKRIEYIAEYMWEICPTKKMKILYEEFNQQKTTQGMTDVAREMFEVYIMREMRFKRWKLRMRLKAKRGQRKRKYDQQEYYELTYKWLCRKFSDFHKVDLEWTNALFCGKPQAGKSAFTFGVVLMRMLQNKPCIFTTRNYIDDAKHMQAKIERFANDHVTHMRQLGFTDTPSIKTVYAGNMSQIKVGKDQEGNDIEEVRGDEEVMDALRGNSMTMVIALANGHQLGAINKVLKKLAEEDDFTAPVLFTDEADAIGYAPIQRPGPKHHRPDEYAILRNFCGQRFEISATVWDILIGNEDLTNTDIVVIRPPPTYKGIRDGVRFIHFTYPIEKWNPNKTLIEEDPNLIVVYKELGNLPVYSSQRYNCESDHPIIILHKTRTQIKHHEAFFNHFKDDRDFGKKWVVIMEADKGISMYSDQLRNKTIEIGKHTFRDTVGNGIFHFRKQTIIPQVLQWLHDNGGAKRFSHIVIKSGHFSGRSRSYVSSNGVWHLTHMYFNGASNIPNLIQAQRILHDRPDSIPLIEYAPLKVIEDLKKADMLQDEQIERLLDLQDQVCTHIQVEKEVWTREKVPRGRLYTGPVNKGFKVQKVDGPDGGWGVEEYTADLEDIKGMDVDKTEEDSKDEDNDGENVVVVQLAKLHCALQQEVFYKHVVAYIREHNMEGRWVRASDLYRTGDRQRTANWYAKGCMEKRGDYLLLKKVDNVFFFKA